MDFSSFVDFVGGEISNWRVQIRIMPSKTGERLRWDFIKRRSILVNGRRKIRYEIGGSKAYGTTG